MKQGSKKRASADGLPLFFLFHAYFRGDDQSNCAADDESHHNYEHLLHPSLPYSDYQSKFIILGLCKKDQVVNILLINFTWL